ncbi:hypothetical protein GPECTOR_54g195 [Gonium pectorale]|uniref:RING-CH-type domain-containing protein n=1 Tax=Gonium pectorale TaxID=33097 RepID=A0A150G6J5_GONPE|nr:hypothetical protein GPECTOR_54g195 [Gonium pectorale]|eukprot:KXZ45454.1 hypothetical protein GPECTOR_54g195 [Gonium pectorale]
MARSAPVRGRSGIPRVASISEIEPVVESDEATPRHSSSLLTRAIMIPSGGGGLDRPRTYRVAPANRSQAAGSQDDVTVVLEDGEGGIAGAGGSSVRGGRAFFTGAGAGSHQDSFHSLDSSGGGVGAVLGTSLRPGSLLSGSFLGGLFGSRPGGRSGNTPDSSVHGTDSLPHARFHHAASDPTLAFGSLPTTSSLLRSRTMNASAGSVLTKATGGLKSSMKKSTSYGQFGLLGGHGADLPPAPSPGGGSRQAGGGGGMGMRPPRRSLNGGSDSSSVSASVGGGGGSGSGFSAWVRGVNIPRGGSRSGLGGEGSSASIGAGRAGSGDSAGGAPVSGRPSEPDLADLAILATSLPASLGTWSLPRSVALASSPHNGASRGGDGSVGGGNRTLSRANSSVSAAASTYAGGSAAGVPVPTSYPICLICLEVLTPAEFESGDAISLQCACKGEVALRHRKCAIEWSHHKGDVVCDVCKQPIANLPPIPEEVLAAREAARRRRQPAFSTSADPNFADYMFDAIRATWVTMIVCVLFFDFNVGQAFFAGAIAGVAFALVSIVIAACARRARALAAARAVERAAAESRAAEVAQRREHEERRAAQERRVARRQQGVGVSFAAGSGAGPSGSRPSSSGSGLMQPLLAEGDESV